MSPALIQPALVEYQVHPTVDRVNSVKTSSIAHDLNAAEDADLGWTPISDDDHAVLGIRNLVLDICMQNGGGHGGSALGMAAIGVALWKYVMRYNPNNPDWFDRDRFVLSNGHASMFLYVMNYLVGYDAWTMDELKGYGDPKLQGFTTMSHGHPEVECPAIEVTTGPLGQGIANAVGFAIAAKNLAANFNRPDKLDIIQSRSYCLTGDGCLMEGVALEAISLAGHLQLDNLVLIYDDNQITCDGPLSWINTEDINLKMRASGWEVLDVWDGRYDVRSIVSAFNKAKEVTGRPTFIHIRTVIGIDTAAAGTAKAHHGGFDKESIAASKALAGLDPLSTHFVPENVLRFFRERKKYGRELESKWTKSLQRYEDSHPELYDQLIGRITAHRDSYSSVLDSIDVGAYAGMATREANGQILSQLWAKIPSLCGGGADLVNANKIVYSTADVFDATSQYKGRYIRHGIREHAMASIANGMAAYHPGTFLPITATFFMFYLYAAPGVRMGALSHLQVIHVATHDSFAEGQNGPTHQPVELDSLFRAMPNLNHIRPCDAEELIGAWTFALGETHAPSIISVARDPVGPVPNTSRFRFQKGAYVIHGEEDADLTLASCGSNLHYVVAAALELKQRGIQCRIVSAPCLDLFDRQDKQYRESVFLPNGKPIISVEEYVAIVWARYCTASIGMTSYGYSASNESNYRRFGLDAAGIVVKVQRYLVNLAGASAREAGWQQL